ncbi:ribosomal protein S3-like protein [Dothistroma septosporum NZE10]|uniref:Small ribosomal subunit protein uS3m n=1 Tax=Dothistroma septosporum (strain NZE10 / CBS 128990) TaxID=675120 RepID=N1PN45_DOTSN|nr:ribosomal protein S3-like protein [Dothistroma septosporum NZE10]
MAPRSLLIPRGSFAFHAKHLQNRLPSQRFASTVAIEAPETAPWQNSIPIVRQAQSVTGSMEWQTSAYSWNKQNTKNLPIAATNVEKLIEGYVTMKQVNNQGKDLRAVRTALAARRKSAEKVYVSKPRIKDFGDRIELTAFIFDGKAAAKEEMQKSFNKNKGKDAGTVGRSGQMDSDILLDEASKAGLQALIARIYGKPVDLRLIRLSKPHLDADILARVVSQRLRDRRNTPRRVIRDATWRAPLPNAQAISKIQQAKAQQQPNKFSFADFTMGNLGQTTNGTIQNKLLLSQVSSVEVEAAGRLTKRLTANRSARKMARRGGNSKGPSVMLRGFRKAHVQYAFAGGKRRVGQFGIRVSLGHA